MLSFFRGYFRFPLFLGLVAACSAAVSSRAELQFFYDPATGAVAFDTAGSPTGFLAAYEFFLDGREADGFAFRGENHVRISNETTFASEPSWLTDSSYTKPLQGFYSIGEVFPVGLSESQWSTLFRIYTIGTVGESIGRYFYSDLIAPGQGSAPSTLTIDFVYGIPDRPFDNRLDLLDPDEIQWANTAALRYDARTGELTLDTTGADSGYIASYNLTSDGAFNGAAYTPPTDSQFVIGDANNISLFTSILEPGVYSLGAILEAGLSSQEFEHIFATASFIARAGYDLGSFDFEADGQALSFTWVPEPSSLALMIVMWSGLGLRKRRAS